MHRSAVRLCTALLPIALLCVPLTLRADWEMRATVIAGGGTSAASGSHRCQLTMAQTSTGRYSGYSAMLGLGFWEQLPPWLAVGQPEEGPALVTRLLQNAPNPFNPSTKLRFTLANSGHVRLDLYDASGRHLLEILDEPRVAGAHSLDFRPEKLASGVYMLQLRVGDHRENCRIVLLK